MVLLFLPGQDGSFVPNISSDRSKLFLILNLADIYPITLTSGTMNNGGIIDNI